MTVTGLQLQWRPFRWLLPRPMHTAAGTWQARAGWLLRLESPDGRLGWGEAGWLCRAREAPPSMSLPSGSQPLAGLEHWLETSAGPIAFALGAAIAELSGEALDPPSSRSAPLLPDASAHLLPAGEAMVPALEAWLESNAGLSQRAPWPSTVKWKVAACKGDLEWRLLDHLLDRLPETARLRLDANGSWDRATSWRWAERLAGEPRVEWLEQPLAPGDLEGLQTLNNRLPVALDESLRLMPRLRSSWLGWQVRRPALEGDPRPLAAGLRRGLPQRMLSTELETGIGRRWLHHLATLQAQGPTPTAPGLAPGWVPASCTGGLFAPSPHEVWEAAAGVQGGDGWALPAPPW